MGGAGSTAQNLAGTGTYNTNGLVDIRMVNSVTVTAASGTIVNGVRLFTIDGLCTLSLPNTLVVKNGTTINNNGTISGAGPLQTQGPVTLNSAVSMTAPFEAVSGTTTAGGNFGQVTIDNGATLFQNNNLTPNGDLTVASGGTLDMTNHFLFFQGTSFANNGALINSVGSFGEFRFNGVGGAVSTAQNLAGTGTYNTNGLVDIRMVSSVTVTAASGTIINGVRLFTIDGSCTLSLPNTLVVKNGTTINNNGTISGAGPLQTQGPVTVNSNVSMTAPFEAVSGTTTGSGNFGQVTIDNGATLLQNNNLTPNGDLTVASGGTLDTANHFLFFQGTTFTNNGSIFNTIGVFGEFRFNGVGGAGSTAQNLAGTGTYNTNGRIDMRLLSGVKVTVASGTVINGVAFLTIDGFCTLDFTGSGGLTLAGVFQTLAQSN